MLEEKSKSLTLAAPEENKKEVYANYFLSDFTDHECRLHFGYLVPQQGETQNLSPEIFSIVKIPLALMPEFIKSLQENLRKQRDQDEAFYSEAKQALEEIDRGEFSTFEEVFGHPQPGI